MAFNRSEDIKFYLYISTSKARMLYEQLSSKTSRKKSIEWNLKLGIASIKGGKTTDEKIERDEMVRRVVEELQARGQLGTLKEPKSFIRDIFPIRWGLFDDNERRPEDEPALVYFGGFHDGHLLGMGGSSRHVVGHEGATSTHSRSSTPTLTRWLLAGLHEGKPPKMSAADRRDDEVEVFQAIAVAQHYLRPPTQKVEFVAKTLAVGEVVGMEPFIGVRKAKAILATPLYVAHFDRPRDNQLWGLSENDWLLDDDPTAQRKLPSAPWSPRHRSKTH
jgi:hypothetical protein